MGGRGIMLSHNNLNSVPMHANGPILKGFFRDQSGYRGMFGSDWGNIGSLQNARVAANVFRYSRSRREVGGDPARRRRSRYTDNGSADSIRRGVGSSTERSLTLWALRSNIYTEPCPSSARRCGGGGAATKQG
jgi:hypothetical protein